MKVLIACEFSGIVRSAFSVLGHDAWSCDLLPTEIPGNHIQGDVLEILDNGWDLMVAHPPCTHLCNRGVYHCKRRGDEWKINKALEFFLELYNAPIPKICLENPVGIISTRFRKPDQYIEPYWFGDNAKKKTGLWLKNLPKLVPTNMLPMPQPLWVDSKGKNRYIVDTLTGKERAKNRSRTFLGVAKAMAEQWGNL